MANIEYSRLLMKRSMTSGVVPTVPLTNNLSDFTATDIFEGELFYNVADGILYSRDLTGIVILASGIVPVNPDLTTVLGIGNNTGPFDIVLDTDQQITNPPSLSPLESFLSLGTTTNNFAVELKSENTLSGNSQGLRLAELLGFNTADISVADSVGNSAFMSLSNDSLSGFTFMQANDAGGNSVSHNVTPFGAFHGFNCFNPTSNHSLIWNQQPSQYDWTINDPINNLTVTEMNDFITGSRRDVTGVSTTNYIEQNLNGKIDIYSFDSSVAALARLELDPASTLLASLTTSGVASSKIDMYATGQVDVIAGDSLNLTSISSKFSINSLPAYDDDAAAGAAGLATNFVYQTTGLGAAPLNVPGIVMIKQ